MSNSTDEPLSIFRIETSDWGVLESSFHLLSPSAQQVLWVSAIPHWFDTPFISYMLLEEENKISTAFNEISALSHMRKSGLAEEVSYYELHSRTRNALRQQWWQDNIKREEFRLLSKRAADYCGEQEYLQNQEPFRWEIERIYHLISYDPKEGIAELNHVSSSWSEHNAYANIELLIHTIRELIENKQLPIEDGGWILFWEAEVDAYYADDAQRQDRAITLLEQIINTNQDIFLSSCSHRSLGRIWSTSGKYDEAIQEYEKALNLFNKQGLHKEMAQCYYQLGQTYLKKENGFELAYPVFEEAKLLYKKIKATQEFQNCLLTLGDIALWLGQYEKAFANYQEISKGHKKDNKADAVFKLGTIKEINGQYAEAQTLYEKTLSYYSHEDDRYLEAQIRINISSQKQDCVLKPTIQESSNMLVAKRVQLENILYGTSERVGGQTWWMQSSLAATSDKIFIATTNEYSKRGKVVALNQRTLEKIWDYSIPNDYVVWKPVLLNRSKFLLLGPMNVGIDSSKNYLITLNTENGGELSRYELFPEENVYAMAVNDLHVFVLTSQRALTFVFDSQSLILNSEKNLTNLLGIEGIPPSVSVVVDEERLFITFEASQIKSFSWDWEDETTYSWPEGINKTFVRPICTTSTSIFASTNDGSIVAFNKTTREKLWDRGLGQRIDSNPIIIGDSLLVSFKVQTIDERVHAIAPLSLHDGNDINGVEPFRQIPDIESTFLSRSIQNLTQQEDYILCTSGQSLFLLEAKSLKEIDRYDGFSHSIFAEPLLKRGFIYCVDHYADVFILVPQTLDKENHLLLLEQLLNDHYTLNELKLLCNNLELSFEQLVGKSKMNKVREIVQFCKQSNQLTSLKFLMGDKFGQQ